MKHLRQLFLVGTIVAAPLFAQSINLRGKVVDPTGAPVVNAEIVLKALQFSTFTDNKGEFRIDQNVSVISPDAAHPSKNLIAITPKFLELGNFYHAAITVYSIRGAILNEHAVVNRNRVAMSHLIPAATTSQSVVIAIQTQNRTISITAIKCGAEWLCNDRLIIESSNGTQQERADAAAVDTLIVAKLGMKNAIRPLTSLVATIPDIVMDYFDNGDKKGVATIMGDVAFSEPGKTFKTPLSVSLSTKIAGAEIRYSTDGKLPAATSTLYSAAIAISQTTQLRAAAFVNGAPSGKPSTAIYIARDFDYTSDIPIIVLEGYGGGKPTDKYTFIDAGFMSFEPVNGVASLDNAPTIATRAGYHLRGQSSCGFKQSPYRVELWDNDNNDADYPLCGMPSGSDWTLISPCTDNTLVRNVFAFDLANAMGLATVPYRFAEIFINQDGGTLQMDDYEGIYQIIPPIKNRKNTLDLKQLKSTDTDPAKITGGYILKFDQAVNDKGMIKLECTGAKKMTTVSFGPTPRDTTATCYADLELVDPAEPNQQQITYITNYVQEFHDVLHGKKTGDWKSYIDMNSFVNTHLLNEATRNVDAWIRSHYMYKERGKPIATSPVWDYNFAMGNYTLDTLEWHVDSNRVGSNDWHRMMWKKAEFKTAVKSRYTELRKTVLSNDAIVKRIDDVKKPLNNIGPRNFSAWPIGTCSDFAMMNACMGGGGLKKTAMGGFFATEKNTDTTWAGNIDTLKVWMKRRLSRMDTLMSRLP